MSVITDLKKTINYAGRNGVVETFYAARERLREKSDDRHYHYSDPGDEILASQRAIYECLREGASPAEVFGPEFNDREMPCISLLVPACETEPEILIGSMKC